MHVHIYVFYMDFWAISFYLLVCYVRTYTHLCTAMHVYVHKILLVCYVHLSTAMYMYMYNIRTHSSSSSLAAVERAKRAREVERNKNLARLSLLDMEIEQDKGGAHIAPSVAWGYGPALAMPTLMGMMGGEEGAGQEEGEVGKSYVHVYLKSTSYLN